MLGKWNHRFLDRVFTHEEQGYAMRKARPAISLAAFFAAKEASVKAMGTGFSHGIQFRDIYVTHEKSGRPLINLAGQALEIAISSGASSWHVSLSHDGDFALAFVVMEMGPQ